MSEPNEIRGIAAEFEDLQLIAEWNAKLAALGTKTEIWLVGEEVWPASLEDDSPYQIGYAQVEGEWQLAFRSCGVQEVIDGTDAGVFAYECGKVSWEVVRDSIAEAEPLLQAPSKVRIAALALVERIAARESIAKL
jgi:hypothetical protein